MHKAELGNAVTHAGSPVNTGLFTVNDALSISK